MSTTSPLPTYSLPPVSHAGVAPTPAGPSISPAISPGGTVATVLLASSIAVGANMVAVKRGTMTPGMAVINGLAREPLPV